jgi:hypothetical protein
MTARYTINELRLTNLMTFDKPKRQLQFYYDFEVKKWRACEPYEQLPYNLMMYRFLDEPESELVVVTTTDSYRIADKPNLVSDTHMKKELIWRERIVHNNARLDYRDDKYGWVKAQVAWVKDEVVHGLLNLIHMKTCYGLGFCYKESKRLAPYGTYTVKYTPEQIRERKLKEEKARDEGELRLRPINNILNTLNRLKYGTQVDIFDYRPFYESLKMTDELIKYEEFRDGGLRTEKWEENISKIFGTLLIRREMDAVTFSGERKLEYNNFLKHHYFDLDIIVDCFWNIRIYGLKEDYPTNNIIAECNGLDVCNAKWDKTLGCFIFDDFTKKTPLVKPHGNPLRVKVKGLVDPKDLILKYEGLLLNTIPHRIIVLNNGFSLTYVKSKNSYLFGGCLHNPPILAPINEVIVVTPKDRKLLPNVEPDDESITMVRETPKDFVPLIK